MQVTDSKKKTTGKRQIEFYTDPEYRKLLRYMKEQEAKSNGDLGRGNWRDKTGLVRFLFSTGCRMGEAIEVKIENCFDNYVYLENTKNGESRYPEILPESLEWWREFLDRAKKANRKYLFPGVYESLGTKFIPVSEKHLSRFTAITWWREVIFKAGLRPLGSHAARRTFATWEAERLSALDLKQQLGHKMLETTEKYYLGSIPGRRYEKVEPEWRKEMRER